MQINQEVRIRKSIALKGRIFSNATKDKMSIAAKNKSSQLKEKAIDALKKYQEKKRNDPNRIKQVEAVLS